MLQNDKTMTYGSHISALLTLGIPIIIGQLGSVVQGLADTIMVGQYNTTALAASGFVNNIMTLILVFALGYSYAITPLVGPLHARNENHEAGKTLKAGLQVNAILGAALFFLMGTLYFMLDKMGQPEELLPVIRLYYLIILISLPFQTLFNGFKQFFDGVGHTQTPMWIMLVSNLLNILGNWLLIYGIGPFPELGLFGAGISTLFSRIFMLAAIYIFFISSSEYKKYHSGFRTKESVGCLRKQLNHLGHPLALQMGMECASFSLCAIMQGWLGSTALAAHQIMTNISSICFMVYYGIGAAVAVRVSHFYGTNDLLNVRRSAFTGYLLIFIAGIILSTFTALLTPQICSLFTDDIGVQNIVISMVFPFIIYQLGDGLQVNFGNSLRGIADVQPLMRYAFICYILISLPLSYFFAFTLHGGAAGIWWAFPVALTTAGLLFLHRFMAKTKQ